MIAQFRRQAARVLQVLPLCVLAGAAAQAAPNAAYPQVDASSQEQFILELINNARANPAGEGARLASINDPEIHRYYAHYGVDTNRLRSDFSGYAVQPPLAFNPRLMASSRQQSLDQASHGFQGHDGTDGSHFDTRIRNQGYDYAALGENVFAYVETPFFGHVGLNADWGVPDLDHRRNIMNTDASFPVYKEIGISCVPCSIKNFGPLIITQDFGRPADPATAYLVGVVYNDINGNGMYDEGEGVAGVTVTPDRGDYYAVTTASGGYTLPLPVGGGSVTVTAAGGGLSASRTKAAVVTDGVNAKLDFTNRDPAGPALPTVAVKTTTAQASVDANQAGVITITRKGAADADMAVTLSVGGNAVSGVDYEALPASVTIPAGAKSVSVAVTPLASTFAGVKKVKVKAAPSSEYKVVTARAKASVKIIGAN